MEGPGDSIDFCPWCQQRTCGALGIELSLEAGLPDLVVLPEPRISGLEYSKNSKE